MRVRALAILVALAIFITMSSACRSLVEGRDAPTTVAPIATPTLAPTVAPTRIPTSTPAPAALTIEALKNAEYASEFVSGGKVQLVNGSFKGKTSPGAAAETTITLRDIIAFGDLNGDGRDDAVVVLVANTGGTGSFYTLAAVLNQNGKPQHVASALLGDRVVLKSITVQAGTIAVNMITQGPSDPLCCPTLEVNQRYKLQDGKLVKLD